MSLRTIALKFCQRRTESLFRNIVEVYKGYKRTKYRIKTTLLLIAMAVIYISENGKYV